MASGANLCSPQAKTRTPWGGTAPAPRGTLSHQCRSHDPSCGGSGFRRNLRIRTRKGQASNCSRPAASNRPTTSKRTGEYSRKTPIAAAMYPVISANAAPGSTETPLGCRAFCRQGLPAEKTDAGGLRPHRAAGEGALDGGNAKRSSSGHLGASLRSAGASTPSLR
jgi:hypothetical protein